MTKIFTNHFGLLRLIFANQMLKSTNHCLSGYPLISSPGKESKGKGKGAYLVGCYQYI